jgi:hypothetical protein
MRPAFVEYYGAQDRRNLQGQNILLIPIDKLFCLTSIDRGPGKAK